MTVHSNIFPVSMYCSKDILVLVKVGTLESNCTHKYIFIASKHSQQ